MGVVGATMESVHSSDGRARNVHLVRVEKLHMAHDDCRSYFRDRTIHCTQRFRNEEEMGRCSVLGGEDLHNAERLESWGAKSCEKPATRSGVPSQRKIPLQLVDEVCQE